MNDVSAFAPIYRQTTAATSGDCIPGVTVAVVNATSVPSAVLPGSTSQNGYVQFQISNKTSVWVHVNFGILGSVRAATLNDYPVPPGTAVTVTVLAEVNAAAVFADGAPAGSTSVVITRGMGV